MTATVTATATVTEWGMTATVTTTVTGTATTDAALSPFAATTDLSVELGAATNYHRRTTVRARPPQREDKRLSQKIKIM